MIVCNPLQFSPNRHGGCSMKNPIVDWLQERMDNCLKIADTKSGRDQLGWIQDAEHFAMAIATITNLEKRLIEAPPDAIWAIDEHGERRLYRYTGPTIEELRDQRKTGEV